MRGKSQKTNDTLEARLELANRRTDKEQNRIARLLDRQEITLEEANRLFMLNYDNYLDSLLDFWIGTNKREAEMAHTRYGVDCTKKRGTYQPDQDNAIVDISIRPILHARALAEIIRGTAVIEPKSHTLYIDPPSSSTSRSVVNPGTYDSQGNYTPEFLAILNSLDDSDKQNFEKVTAMYIVKCFTPYIEAALDRFDMMALNHTLHTLAKGKGIDIKPSTKRDIKETGKIGNLVTQPLIKTRGRGGQSPKYHWTIPEREELGHYYQTLNPIYVKARAYCRKQLKLYTNTRKSLIIPKKAVESIIGLSKEIYPEIEETILRYYLDHTEATYAYHYRPANQAIEHAARLAKKDYPPCGLTPKELSKYLPKTYINTTKAKGRKKRRT